MQKAINIKELEIEFQGECTLVDFKYEYPDFVGEERFGIITSLDEQEMIGKYGELLAFLRPYVILPLSYNEVRKEYDRNENKHQKRSQLYGEAYGFDEIQSAIYHPELSTYDEMTWEKEEQWAKEEEMQKTLSFMREGFRELTEVQMRRVYAVFFEGKTSREVAEQEGVNYSKVDKSIAQSLKKLKKYLKKRGCKTPF